MIKVLSLTLALPLLTVTAAQARPNTTAMRCADAQALVAQGGAVVMNTGPRTFRRFVANVGYCDRTQRIRPSYAPAADARQCQVAYECYDPQRFTGGR